MEVTPAGPEDQEAIAKLLRSIFGSEMSPTLLSPELLKWKFFSPRPGLTGSRSFVIRDADEIVAHGCEWPVSFLAPAGEVFGCHIIDWAARPEAKGTGVHMYQHLMAKNQTVLAIGGSTHARKLLPRLGFKPCGRLDGFARVVRPWRQYRSRPRRAGWREVGRFARNAMWSLEPLKTTAPSWTTSPMADAYALPGSVMRIAASTFCCGVRSASFLQYLLECPIMKCSLFALSRTGVPCGYFVLNTIAGQCRIIDLAVDSETPADWVAAYRMAVATARRLKTTYEITAVSSLPWLSEALSQIGFRLREQTPVMLYDPTKKFVGAPPLHLRMTDNDACFLLNEMYPYLT